MLHRKANLQPKIQVGILFVLTLVLTSSCAWVKPKPYKSPLGNVFKRDISEGDWSNVPDYIKHNLRKMRRNPEEIIQAYVYIGEHEPDPTVRPQAHLSGGSSDPSQFGQFYWLGVCASTHPYHRARCNMRAGEITPLPKKIVFPKTETEIEDAERYLQELGDESVQSIWGFSNRTDRLVPPEFDRSTRRWLDVCHPNHTQHDSCHILREKHSIEKRNECIAEGVVRINKRYETPSFPIELLPILGDLVGAVGVTGSDLEKAGYRSEVFKLKQRCLNGNWNRGKKYLRHLTSNR